MGLKFPALNVSLVPPSTIDDIVDIVDIVDIIDTMNDIHIIDAPHVPRSPQPGLRLQGSQHFLRDGAPFLCEREVDLHARAQPAQELDGA